MPDVVADRSVVRRAVGRRQAELHEIDYALD